MLLFKSFYFLSPEKIFLFFLFSCKILFHAIVGNIYLLIVYAVFFLVNYAILSLKLKAKFSFILLLSTLYNYIWKYVAFINIFLPYYMPIYNIIKPYYIRLYYLLIIPILSYIIDFLGFFQNIILYEFLKKIIKLIFLL